MSPTVPERPGLEGLERKWDAAWEAEGTYRFDRGAARDRVWSIDTPPPTVSGSLHVGHVFAYTHTDALARFHRMRGREVFYPMGWDDNGLPTERRVQNHFGVRCDPALAYVPDLELPESKGKHPLAVSRPNFVELCNRLTAEDEKAFEDLWRYLGLSVDWTMTYATIDDRAQRVSQRSFLRLLGRGFAYQAEAPTLWDVDFQTAVAQAELEDREVPGAYHRIRFGGSDGQSVEIDTTRPELIPACVALVAHPDDERYRPLVGTELTTPLFGVPVPVKTHQLADPEKGTGIAMICTFGDVTDVVWWRELALPVRAVVERNGRLQDALPHGVDGEGARGAWDELRGKTLKQARARIVELLRHSGDLVGEPRGVTHAVKFYERGDRPLEIVTSRQWFIRTMEHRDEFLARGEELRWHPPYMRARFEAWVRGLTGDWLVSRQRFFGVPFPLWYPLGLDGAVDYERPLLPDERRLPVDPSTDVPDGYTADERDVPGGFTADPDVMDTWATSSLTPQIATGWEDDPDGFARTFPMNLRPQGHEIIRTWLFSTIVRSHFEHDRLPWSDAAINGWVLDPDRKKMSKSKGNVVTPLTLLEQYGSDAVRYWAASGRPGTDTALDEGQMRVGRRLAIKLLNVSKFVLSLPAPPGAVSPEPISSPLDQAMLARLAELVEATTVAFEGFDYARALERTEAFFWAFADDYLELVKSRAYGGQGSGPPAPWGRSGPEAAASALGALRLALSALQRLLAPFLPFVTEEVWSWWQEGSVHRALWPTVAELGDAPALGDPLVLDVASDVLSEVRKAKTAARVTLRTGADRVVVMDTADRLAALGSAASDVRQAGHIAELATEEASTPSVEVALSPPPSALPGLSPPPGALPGPAEA